jgi:hypothetical protein
MEEDADTKLEQLSNHPPKRYAGKTVAGTVLDGTSADVCFVIRTVLCRTRDSYRNGSQQTKLLRRSSH